MGICLVSIPKPAGFLLSKYLLGICLVNLASKAKTNGVSTIAPLIPIQCTWCKRQKTDGLTIYIYILCSDTQMYDHLTAALEVFFSTLRFLPRPKQTGLVEMYLSFSKYITYMQQQQQQQCVLSLPLFPAYVRTDARTENEQLRPPASSGLWLEEGIFLRY